ncbi:MAG TPA: TerB family tellurite resistance protein [Myxococcales bacterium]|nr:TerB family tellurite resistance protein [Myxococcales bacterium]
MRDARPIYELMVVSVWADGKVQPGEVLAVQRIVSADPAFARLGNRSAIAREVRERVAAKGADAALREAAAAVAPEDREAAFRLCARVVGADGEMAGEDAEVLGTLQEIFGLSGDDVVRLIRARE